MILDSSENIGGILYKHLKGERYIPVCNLCFFRGKAQRHNGTQAHTYDLIVGRMHGWTYLEILTFF